jgi:hypothetical protein
MKPIYLNTKTSQGVETIDEFTIEPQQSNKDFKKYIDKMINEYSIAGINVYKSSRCTKDWSSK